MYGIDVEWHCFSTSHRKSVCDGIGGAFKRRVKRYSLQHPENPIIDAKQLFNWAMSNKSKSVFMFCSNNDYETTSLELANRYDKVKTIPGTQQMHSFKPIGGAQLEVRKYSECPEYEIIKLIK